jgi:hypothetical protein
MLPDIKVSNTFLGVLIMFGWVVVLLAQPATDIWVRISTHDVSCDFDPASGTYEVLDLHMRPSVHTFYTRQPGGERTLSQD